MTYNRKGKQYACRLNRHTVSTEALSSECRAILEPLSGVFYTILIPGSFATPYRYLPSPYIVNAFYYFRLTRDLVAFLAALERFFP